MKSEYSFLAELEQRAGTQKKLVETEMIPGWARGLGDWLAVNPWRVLVPIAGMGYAGWRIGYGIPFRELILGLFGGFK